MNKQGLKTYNFLLIVFGLLTLSCQKMNVGYIEVRNKTHYEISNVNWGGILELGSIKPGDENGGGLAAKMAVEWIEEWQSLQI